MRVIALSLLLGSCTMAATTIYVSPLGHDDGPGTERQPVATLPAALALTRKLPADQPRSIVLAAGEYQVEQTVVLDQRDRGLWLEGAGMGRTTLYGGRRITGFKPIGEGLYAADLPGVKEGEWDFRMLSVNGRYAPRARLPKEGSFLNTNTWDVPWMSTTGGGWKRKPTPEELTTMTFKPGDLGPWLDVRNAELTVYHSWDESVVGIKSIDFDRHTLFFSTPAGHPPGSFNHHEYVVWNVREGLTEPGQWYLDRTNGRVVYRPLDGEDVAQLEVYAPTTNQILRVDGQADQLAIGIIVRGLTLSVAGTPLKAGGFGASAFDGAITVIEAKDCRFEQLEIARVGGQGLKTWKSTGTVVEGCQVHDTGACGIMVREVGGRIVGNHVHHVGLSYPSAIAVWGGGKGGPGMVISHNHVHHTSYTAIACAGEDHLIEANRLHHVMQVMLDGAAIYLTFCKRITVRGNYASDILLPPRGQCHAYYLDEQAEDCVVEDNLAVRCASPHLSHMAKHNTLRHNVWLSDGDLILRFPKSSDYTFEHNVLTAGGSLTIQGPEVLTTWLGNLLYSGNGKVLGRALTNYKAGTETPLEVPDGLLIADPKVVVSDDGKVTFAPGSPAAELGIKPLDVSDAGCP